jgi:hypothetical protein
MVGRFRSQNPQAARYVDQCVEASLMGTYEYCNHLAVARHLPSLIFLYKKLHVAPRAQQPAKEPPGQQQHARSRAYGGGANNVPATVHYRTARNKLFAAVVADKFLIQNIIRENFINLVHHHEPLHEALRHRIWYGEPFVDWIAFKNATYNNCNLFREFLFRNETVPRFSTAAAVAPAPASASGPNSIGSNIVVRRTPAASKQASSGRTLGAAWQNFLQEKHDRQTEDRTALELYAQLSIRAKKCLSADRDDDRAWWNGNLRVCDRRIELRCPSNTIVRLTTGASSQSQVLAELTRVWWGIKNAPQQQQQQQASAASLNTYTPNIDPLHAFFNVLSPSQQQRQPVKHPANGVLQKHLRSIATNGWTATLGLTVERITNAASTPAAPAVVAPPSSSQAAAAAAAANAGEAVVASAAPSATGGASKRKKRKQETLWASMDSYRIYVHQFAELQRRSLSDVYIKLVAKRGSDASRSSLLLFANGGSGSTHDTDEEAAVRRKIEDNRLIRRLGGSSIFGSDGGLEFAAGFSRILRWLHDECGMTVRGVGHICDSFVRFYRRQSPNQIESCLVNLSDRDFALWRYFLLRDQKRNHLHYIQSGIDQNLWALRAVLKHAQIYTNTHTYDSRALRHGIGEVQRDHADCYTTGYTECCDRLTSFDHGVGYGNYKVADQTPLELTVHPQHSFYANHHAHHERRGRTDPAAGPAVDVSWFREHKHLVCCNEKSTRASAASTAAGGPKAPASTSVSIVERKIIDSLAGAGKRGAGAAEMMGEDFDDVDDLVEDMLEELDHQKQQQQGRQHEDGGADGAPKRPKSAAGATAEDDEDAGAARGDAGEDGGADDDLMLLDDEAAKDGDGIADADMDDLMMMMMLTDGEGDGGMREFAGGSGGANKAAAAPSDADSDTVLSCSDVLMQQSAAASAAFASYPSTLRYVPFDLSGNSLLIKQQGGANKPVAAIQQKQQQSGVGGRKRPRVDEEDAEEDAEDTSPAVEAPAETAKRKRGRPPKKQQRTESADGKATADAMRPCQSRGGKAIFFGGESAEKTLKKTARQQLRAASHQPCTVPHKNRVVMFDMFGKVIITCIKNGEIVSYIYCPECGNCTIYCQELWKAGRYMCARCSVLHPKRLVSVHESYGKSFTIVSTAKLQSICGEILNFAASSAATSVESGADRAAAGGGGGVGTTSHVVLYGTSRKMTLIPISTSTAWGVTARVNAYGPRWMFVDAGTKRVRALRARLEQQRIASGAASIEELLPVDDDAVSASGAAADGAAEDDDDDVRSVGGDSVHSFAPTADGREAPASAHGAETAEDAIGRIGSMLAIVAATTAASAAAEQQQQAEQDAAPASGKQQAAPQSSSGSTSQQQQQKHQTTQHQKNMELVVHSSILYRGIQHHFYNTLYVLDDTDARGAFRLKRVTIAPKAIREHYYLSHPQRFSWCSEQGVVDLKFQTMIDNHRHRPQQSNIHSLLSNQHRLLGHLGGKR